MVRLIWLVLAGARAALRLEDVILQRDDGNDWGTVFKRNLYRRCDGRDAGGVLEYVFENGVPFFEWMTCDDPLEAALILCATSGKTVGEAGERCGRAFFERALADGKLGADDAARAVRTLAAADATRAFNEAVDAKGFVFHDDFVTTNWALAWIVDGLRDAPARALEVGAYEGRSAWLWYRLLGPGSTLVCVDLRVADSFAANTRERAVARRARAMSR